MPKIGRPTKLTPQLISEIADAFLCAFTDQQTADLVGIDVRTIERYRAGKLLPGIKKLELKREMGYRLKVWAAKGFWQGAAWFLERKYPTQFAKPEIQLQINNNTLNQVNNTLIVTAEVAHGISSRVKDVDARIERLLKDKRGGNGNGNSHPPEANGK
jgi:hypothetical protein